ncbi:MAG: excinuclease ABC subunit A, partial [Bacteroidetes bacterium]
MVKKEMPVTDQPAAAKQRAARKLRETIEIKGARANNLQNIDLELPKNQLIVVTGVSGSGKSSLTMDTLFAEGQRRYVESLSSYARQFLGRMKKPDVDYIKGICPAIAIEQKVSTSNARSTVGTLTEIYDYIRLLFARIGKTYSPVSGQLVQRHTVSDVVDFIHTLDDGTRVQLMMPLPAKYADRSLKQELSLLLQKGYTRVFWQDQMHQIEDFLENANLDLDKTLAEHRDTDLRVLVDRFVVEKANTDNFNRIADSVQTAFQESEGECILVIEGKKDPVSFNNRFELDGITFLEPTPQLFNFNNSYGACTVCEGFSMVTGISEEKVISNPGLSVFEGAVSCWRGEKHGRWLTRFLENAHHFDFPVHRPYAELSEAQKELLWNGKGTLPGIYPFFEALQEKAYKIQNRVMLARYRGRTICPTCKGARLRKEALYVRVADKNIRDLINLPADELLDFFKNLELSDFDQKIARRLILEITSRLEFMCDVGLTYLTLNRISATLSGGETQRINLTRTLGSNLTNSMYILDEPSVGLHPRDTNRLVRVLKALRDLGNTVIVVEHEEDIIKNADYLIDIGPEAGIHGGKVVFAGPWSDIHTAAPDSLTTQYMTGKMGIPVPKIRRTSANAIHIRG